MAKRRDRESPARVGRVGRRDASPTTDDKLLEHGKILLEYFCSQRKNGKTDVTIEDVMIDKVVVARAHRLVLSAFSSRFKADLMKQERSSNAILEIDPNDAFPEDIRELVNYCYSGECKRSDSLLKSAENLGFETLTRESTRKTQEMIVDDYHATSFLAGLTQLKSCKQFVDFSIKDKHDPKNSTQEVHRAIMNAYTSHFEDKLTEGAHEIDIEQLGITSTVLPFLIDFTYKGYFFVDWETLKHIRSAAKHLGMKRLVAEIDIALAHKAREEVHQEQLQKGHGMELDGIVKPNKRHFEEVGCKKNNRKRKVKTKGAMDSDKEKCDDGREASGKKEKKKRRTDQISDSEWAEGDGSEEFRRRKNDPNGAGILEIKTYADPPDASKPFKCPYTPCIYWAKEKASVQKHMRTHTGEKPFKCRCCGKRFTTPSNRNQHEGRHVQNDTGENLWTCKCGEEFHDFKSLDNHVCRDHFNMPKIKCPRCTRTFYRPEKYRAHCKKQHGLVLADDEEEATGDQWDDQ